MTCWALLPVKASALGKGRLSGFLSSAQRKLLIKTMLADVLVALRRAKSIDQIAIVTSEPKSIDERVMVLEDLGPDLNGTISQAIRQLTCLGAREVLVIHADTPCVRSQEIDDFVAAGRASGLALAPDRNGQGTNALFINLPTDFRFHFGPGSSGLHQAEARLHQLTAKLVVLPGLAFDVDQPADVRQLINISCRHYAFLTEESNNVEWT